MSIKKLVKKTIKVLALLIIIIVLTLAMKVFLFASFKIPTPSMKPTILPGDFVLVYKPTLGPRVYGDWGFLKGEKTKMKRIWKSPIQRNDVVVFDYPYPNPMSDKIEPNGGTYYVKRCVAIPGDTFYIKNGIYKVKDVGNVYSDSDYQQRFAARADSTFNPHVLLAFPNDTIHYCWTIKNFGPLYVPGEGDRIEIDSLSILLYKNLIEYETEKRISIRNGNVYLGDSLLTGYKFKQNYYFMAGDLTFDSNDSRYWGLLSEELIVGRVAFIWKSVDMKTKKCRWDRFFKRVK